MSQKVGSGGSSSTAGESAEERQKRLTRERMAEAQKRALAARASAPGPKPSLAPAPRPSLSSPTTPSLSAPTPRPSIPSDGFERPRMSAPVPALSSPDRMVPTRASLTGPGARSPLAPAPTPLGPPSDVSTFSSARALAISLDAVTDPRAAALATTPTAAPPTNVAAALTSDEVAAAAAQLRLPAERLAALPPEVQQKLKAALDAMKAGKHDEGLKALADAAAAYANTPEGKKLIQDVAKALAEHLPDGAAKTALSDPKLVEALLKPENLQALQQLASDPKKALATLLKDPALRNGAIDALAADPRVKAALDKLGLTVDDLKRVGDAAPHLLEALEHLTATPPRAAEAAKALGAAMEKAKALVGPLIDKLARKLDDGPLKSLLTNPRFRDALTKPETIDAVTKLLSGDPAKVLEGARALLDQPGLRDAVLDALTKDPAVAKALEALKLTPEDLKQAGAAAPHLLDAAAAAAKGEWGKMFEALKAAGQQARALGQKLFAKLPEDLRKNLEQLGIDQHNFGQLADAGPHLFDAAKALMGPPPDPAKALGHLRDALLAAPNIARQLLDRAGDRLPDGPLKKLLQNDKFRNALKDQKTFDAAMKLLSGDPQKILEGMRDLAANKDLRGALMGVAASDPRVAKALEALGLKPADLAIVGEGLPHLLDAAIALSKGDWKAAFEAIKQAGAKGRQAFLLAGEALFNKLPEGVRKGLEQLGIDAKNWHQLADAGPHLLAAAEKLGKSPLDAGAVLRDLAAALQAAPDIAKKALDMAAQRLPDGPLKTLVQDPAFREALADPKTLDAAVKLLSGKAEDVLAGARELLANEKLRGAVLRAVATNPHVAQALEKLGLTADDLVQAGAAAPHLLDAAIAAGKGEWQQALASLKEAANASADVLAKLGEKTFNKLDPKVREQLAKLGIDGKTFPQLGKAAPHLLDAASKLLAKPPDVTGALKSVVAAAEAAPDIVRKALDSLTASLPPGPLKTLLSDPKFRDALKDPKVLDAVGKLVTGNREEALAAARELLSHEGLRDSVLRAVGQNEHVQKALTALGLTTDDLVQAGAAAPHLFDAALAALKNDGPGTLDALRKAAEAAPDLLKKIGRNVFEKLPKPVKDALAKVGIDANNVHELADAAPAMLAAARDVLNGDFKSALQHLAEAAQKAPTIAKQALEQLKKHAPSPLKEFLNNPRLGDVLTNPDVLRSAAKLADKDPKVVLEGVKELLANKDVRALAIETLAAIPQVKALLDKAGLTAKDLVEASDAAPHLFAALDAAQRGDFGAAAQALKDAAAAAPGLVKKMTDALFKSLPPGVQKALGELGITKDNLHELKDSLGFALQAAERLAAGDPVGALQAMGQAIGALPPEVAKKMAEKIVSALGLPKEYAQLIIETPALLADEKLRTEFTEAMQALGRGDVGAFVAGLARVGQQLATNHPAVAVALLNSLGKLPGGIGRFFRDPNLNAALVRTRALTDAFKALELLAQGKTREAMGALMGAFGKLATEGGPMNIAGREVPFGMEGIQNLQMLMTQFVKALPEPMQKKLEQLAIKLAAEAGLKVIPGVGLLSAAWQVPDLVRALNEEPKDWTKISLIMASIGVDLASNVPALAPVTTPARWAIAVAQFFDGLGFGPDEAWTMITDQPRRAA